MSGITYLLFDAANTLIHKPALWKGFETVLTKNNISFSTAELRKKHKLRSEAVHFPDRTTADFYRNFNAALLQDLNIDPKAELLEEIFAACTYLPWEKFEDTAIISSFSCKKGVISNFNSSLRGMLQAMFGDLFSDIVVSEELGIGKPEVKFYELALKKIGAHPENILYIGDSIRLDVEPAEKAGIRALLIDRDNVYPDFEKRINSLTELEHYL